MPSALLEPYSTRFQGKSELLMQDFEESREFGNYKLGDFAIFIAERDGKWSYVLRTNLQGAHFARHNSVRISCRRSKEMPGIAVKTNDGAHVSLSFVFESELDEFVHEFDLVEDESAGCVVASGAPAFPAPPGELT